MGTHRSGGRKSSSTALARACLEMVASRRHSRWARTGLVGAKAARPHWQELAWKWWHRGDTPDGHAQVWWAQKQLDRIGKSLPGNGGIEATLPMGTHRSGGRKSSSTALARACLEMVASR